MLSWLKGDKVDHPLANAKAAQTIVDAFPYRDPWKTLEDVNYWLSSVNETADFKVQQRFEVMDMLDLATRKAQDQLLHNYLALPEGDHIHEKRIWKTATDFWKLLGDGYLICLKQASEPKAVSGEFKPQLPVVSARTLRALRQQMKWILMRYGVIRASFWGDIGHCMTFAESVDVAQTEVEVYPGVAHSAVVQEFLGVMLFWASSPSGLSPREQDIAERLVFNLTPKFRYDAASWDGCDFCFDLGTLRPPLRLVPTTPVSESTRYFDVTDGRPAVQAMFELAAGGRMPPRVDVGSVTDSTIVARVLKHIIFNWAKEMPARASERRKTALRLFVVHGYQNVLSAIEPSAGSDIPDKLPHDVWVAADVCAGGYGVIVPAGKGDWLCVGLLLAVRSEMEKNWNIGIIRRVKGDDHNQRQVGIQLISKVPVPIYLRSLTGVEHGTRRQHAVLLSTRASPNGSMHIVAKRDLFVGRERLEAMYGNPPQAAVFETGAIMETGQDFEWLRYKLAEATA